MADWYLYVDESGRFRREQDQDLEDVVVGGLLVPEATHFISKKKLNPPPELPWPLHAAHLNLPILVAINYRARHPHQGPAGPNTLGACAGQLARNFERLGTLSAKFKQAVRDVRAGQQLTLSTLRQLQDFIREFQSEESAAFIHEHGTLYAAVLRQTDEATHIAQQLGQPANIPILATIDYCARHALAQEPNPTDAGATAERVRSLFRQVDDLARDFNSAIESLGHASPILPDYKVIDRLNAFVRDHHEQLFTTIETHQRVAVGRVIGAIQNLPPGVATVLAGEAENGDSVDDVPEVPADRYETLRYLAVLKCALERSQDILRHYEGPHTIHLRISQRGVCYTHGIYERLRKEHLEDLVAALPNDITFCADNESSREYFRPDTPVPMVFADFITNHARRPLRRSHPLVDVVQKFAEWGLQPQQLCTSGRVEGQATQFSHLAATGSPQQCVGDARFCRTPPQPGQRVRPPWFEEQAETWAAWLWLRNNCGRPLGAAGPIAPVPPASPAV